MDDVPTLIRARLKQKRVTLPLATDGYLRGSGLARLCPREEILTSELKVTRTSVEGPDSLLTFAHGHGLHFALQNHVLPTIGVLYGRWLCIDCGTFYGTPRESFPLRVEDGVIPPVLEGVLVPRPTVCESCGGTEFLYRELYYAAPEYGTGGHPDGFLKLEGREGLGLLEAKSTAMLWEVRHAPYVAHAIQVQTYLWFTGLTWGVILYWGKGAQDSPSSLVAHIVERDEETIEQIKVALRSVWEGLRGGPLPGRVCFREDAPRARECPVAKVCFERPDRPELPAEEEPPILSAGFDEQTAGGIF